MPLACAMALTIVHAPQRSARTSGPNTYLVLYELCILVAPLRSLQGFDTVITDALFDYMYSILKRNFSAG